MHHYRTHLIIFLASSECYELKSPQRLLVSGVRANVAGNAAHHSTTSAESHFFFLFWYCVREGQCCVCRKCLLYCVEKVFLFILNQTGTYYFPLTVIKVMAAVWEKMVAGSVKMRLEQPWRTVMYQRVVESIVPPCCFKLHRWTGADIVQTCGGVACAALRFLQCCRRKCIKRARAHTRANTPIVPLSSVVP